MDAFSKLDKKDTWMDPHANASMAEMMRERKEAAEAKRMEMLRLKREEQQMEEQKKDNIAERAARLK